MAKRRKPGSGSVHLRKDGRWEGRYVVGYDERGYPRTKNCLAKTKGECLRKLKTLREQCRPPEQPKEIESGMTFGAWLDHWYQTCSMPALRPSTQQEYELRIYRHIIPALGEIPLNKLTEANLQQFYHQLKHGGRLDKNGPLPAGIVRTPCGGAPHHLPGGAGPGGGGGADPHEPRRGLQAARGGAPGDAGADP